MCKVIFLIDKWWLPWALGSVSLTGFTICALQYGSFFSQLAWILFVAFGITLLWALVASIVNFCRRSWAIGLAQLASLPALVVAFLFAMGLIFANAFFGPSEDGFADNLTIPSDIEVADPLPERQGSADIAEADDFQAALRSSLQVEPKGDANVAANVDALARLQRNSPDILARYLASSPAWRVFEEDGKRFATRRWKVAGHWHYDLHGYYTNFDLDSFSDDLPRFQSRVTLGFAGSPWARVNDECTRLKAGETRLVELSRGNEQQESRCLIDVNGLLLEVFEQSAADERRLTKATLDFLEKELKPLADAPNWDTIRSLLSDDRIVSGEPSLELQGSLGTYNATIRVNPGEPGRVYLKAFEVTQGTALSTIELKETSNEWIGWSDDPAQLFLSDTHFTIYEGDWGKPYAARFEVWFEPDSGAAQRKLLEKVYKIEGWQR